jgi:hypothetical protein
MAQNYIIVSYYTHNTEYAYEALRFKESLQELDLEFDIQGVKNTGSWLLNELYRPQFLLDMFAKHQKPIVWIDVDARVFHEPVLFNSITEPLGLVYFDDVPLIGTMYFDFCVEAQDLIDCWRLRCEKTSKKGQTVFRRVLKSSDIKIFKLPYSYCYLSLEKRYEPSPIIVHDYASRRLRNTVKF